MFDFLRRLMYGRYGNDTLNLLVVKNGCVLGAGIPLWIQAAAVVINFVVPISFFSLIPNNHEPLVGVFQQHHRSDGQNLVIGIHAQASLSDF